MLYARYLDDKKMGKAYLIASDDWRAIPGMQAGGVDVLSPEFTPERFLSLLRHRRHPHRVKCRRPGRPGSPRSPGTDSPSCGTRAGAAAGAFGSTAVSSR